jgi:AcrR family transcriptional regulator
VAVTSERIEAAAREILVAEGSAAVTMRRVAAAVGLTPMAIYRHHANREALLGAVADAAFAELAESAAGLVFDGAAGDELRARLNRALDEHLDFALGQPNLYAFLFTEPRPAARRYPADFGAGQSPTFTVLVDGLTRAARTGLIADEDVPRLGLIVAAELHGLVGLYHGGRIALSDNDFRDLCHAAVWRILGGAG